jgi:hypothetical protein
MYLGVHGFDVHGFDVHGFDVHGVGCLVSIDSHALDNAIATKQYFGYESVTCLRLAASKANADLSFADAINQTTPICS